MNYNEMTAAKCADWLAERERWRLLAAAGGYGGYWVKTNADGKIIQTSDYHPFPLTLDAAAGALREPWVIHRICWHTAHVSVSMWRRNSACWKNVHGPDELTARYRAAVAARMEEDK